MHIPRKSLLAGVFTYETHKRTMHGGFILTMAAVRENYWISKPGRLAKRVVRNCFWCKRFDTKPFTTQK